MPKLNRVKLVRNIRELMKKNSVTQAKLAEVLGMSQPNVSKALSEKDKKSFTLAQVVDIAEYFRVSVDFLVGNGSCSALHVSKRSIGRLLADLIENDYLNYHVFSIEEIAYLWDDDYEGYAPRKIKVTYPALYFPMY